MKRSLLVLAVLAIAQLSAGLANAKRVALVVGNDDYTTLPKLEKAVNDARGVGETLRGLGFQVFEGINAGRKDMEAKIAELEAAIEPGDEVFFFYAGHGVALGTENFLIPVDLPTPKPGDEKAVKKAAISADALVGRIEYTAATNGNPDCAPLAGWVLMRSWPIFSRRVGAAGGTAGMADGVGGRNELRA